MLRDLASKAHAIHAHMEVYSRAIGDSQRQVLVTGVEATPVRSGRLGQGLFADPVLSPAVLRRWHRGLLNVDGKIATRRRLISSQP